jgi:hypothetical protein
MIYICSNQNQNRNFVAAIIQTLKTDEPEMVNLIYSISSTTNNGKQYKDNNDIVTNYLEFHKDD